MIYRLYPTKDTFITDLRRQNVAQSSSNFGASEILHVFSVAPVSSSIFLSGSLGRILSKFDLSSLSSVTGTSHVSYRLRMADAQHNGTLPTSYDLEVLQLSTDWDEGRGRDNDFLLDRGFANWDRPKSNSFWASPGGDVVASPVSSFHLDDGHEDMSVDVTPHVESWLSGTVPNYGFMVRVSSTLELSSQDYYVKMFHSRQTHFGDRKPYLEASWDDSVRTGSVSLVTDDGPFYVNVTNLHDEYTPEEKVRLRLFVRKRDYNPAVVMTASASPVGVVVDPAYYRIDDDRTKERVVDFGTGSNNATRLSYDASGSYFDFHMSNLPTGSVYRLKFLFDIGSGKQVIDPGFKFRVL